MELDKEYWDIEIKPRASKFSLNFKDVWHYKDLLMMYVRRDIVVTYKQTVLGPLWFVIQPILTTVMFMFVFGGIAEISTDGLPQAPFYMAGLICWTYFSDCLNKISTTFTTNAGVFSKVYFPRLIVPLSVVMSNLVKFAIQFTLFILIYIYFVFDGAGICMNRYALLFPILMFMLAGLSLGFGIIISSMTTKYRDLAFLFAFAVQLWMYVTPVIYPLSLMEEKYAKWMWLIQMNPLTSIIEAFKYGFLGSGTFTWLSLGYSFFFTVSVLILGAWVFNKVERSFVDVV